MKFLLLLSVALGLTAGPAMADPVSAIASVFIKAGMGAFAAVAAAQISIGIAFNALSAAIMKRKQGKSGVDVKLDIELGDDTPLNFSLGKSATAGKRKFLSPWGGKYISEVIEYSSLPQGLAGLWVGDEKGEVYWDQTDTDGTPYNLGHPLENHRDDGFRIWLKVYSGEQVAADPLLVTLFSNDPDYPWTEEHIGRGKSYVVLTARYDSDTLTSYPTYLLEPAPLPVYDPRKDSTAGGLGPQRWGDRSTYEPSENPAVIAYNIARGIYFGGEWLWGGKNLPAWRLPVDEWIAAMNACDAGVELDGGGSEPAYRIGCEISVDMEPLDVLEEIGRGANMRFAEVGGRLKPLVDLPASAVFSVTDEDIVITEGQSFRPFAPISEVYNALSATYPEPREKWASKDAPEYVDAGFTAADGGRYLPTGVSYSVVPFAEQVQRLMRSQMREYRRERILQFSLPADGYVLEPLDVISYTSAKNGFVNKRFIVENITKLPAMRVQVTLREVDPSDYDWSPSDQLPYTITPPAPVVPFVQGIADFTAAAVVVSDTSGRGRRVAIQVSCAAGEVGITDVRVQIRKVGGGVDFDLTRPYDAPYQWQITDVVQATTYQVRGQLVSKLTGAREWSGWLSVTTADLKLISDDLAPSVWDTIYDEIEAGGVPTYTALPASGVKPDQVVMKVPEGILYRWDATAGVWTTQIVATVADASLEITKFAPSIQPPLVWTAALPTTRQNSDVLIKDGKLYRWSGSAYVATVPTSDLSGTVAAAQIADNAIGAAKIAVGAITSTKISDDAITASKIAASAIGAGHIAANAISVRHLAVTNFEELADTRFDVLMSDGLGAVATATWLERGDGDRTSNPFWDVYETPTASYRTNRVLRFKKENSYNGAHTSVGNIIRGLNSTTTYKVSGLMGVQSVAGTPNTRVHVLIHTYDQGMNYKRSIYSGAWTPSETTWVLKEFDFEVKLNNDESAICVILEAAEIGGGQLTRDVLFNGVSVRAMNEGRLIVDGAIGADKIAANAITSAKIMAGAVGANEIAANVIGAKHLTISDYSNIIPDAGLYEEGTWYAQGVDDQINFATARANFAGLRCLGFTAATAQTGWTNGAWSKLFAVDQNIEYCVSFKLLKPTVAMATNVRVRLDWFDASETYIGFDHVDTSLNNTTRWVDNYFNIAARAEAKFARVSYYVQRTNFLVGESVWAGNFVVRRRHGGELIVDGAISTNKLAANSVTANAIAANAVTANAILAGAVTAAKINVGNLSSISANVGTLTAGIIRSSNYVAGVSGMNINLSTGNMELNNLIARGAIQAGAVSSMPFFSATNQVSYSTASVSGMGSITVVKESSRPIPIFYGAKVLAVRSNVNIFLKINGVKAGAPSVNPSALTEQGMWALTGPAGTYTVELFTERVGEGTATATFIDRFLFALQIER